MRLKTLVTVLVAFVATITMVHKAHSDDLIELGRLECFIDAGGSFVIGSSKDISCVFTSNNAEWGEDNYFGVINRLGIDIGTTGEGYMTWLVVAATGKDWEPGFLAGDYIGAGASASFAVGLGANVLVGGGSGKSFALQPLSLQTQKGINVAAGIAELQLRSIN